MKRFAILFSLVLGMAALRADDTVEVALYLGLNNPPPVHLNRFAPEDLRDRLRQVFGFSHYELLKAGRIDLDRPWAQWFVPRKDFFICVKPLPPRADEPRLVDYEIYQEGFLVVKGKYEPREDTPLFINGPDFQNGRLIFVLEMH